jgi:hypothetical protein
MLILNSHIIITNIIPSTFNITIINQALFLGEPFSAVSLLVKQVVATAIWSYFVETSLFSHPLVEIKQGSQTRAITARRIPPCAIPNVLKEHHRISQTLDADGDRSEITGVWLVT